MRKRSGKKWNTGLALLLCLAGLSGCQNASGLPETSETEQEERIQIGITFDSFIIEFGFFLFFEKEIFFF